MPQYARQIGPYTLGEQLGRGGMATVHRATDSRNGRTVALKMLPGGYVQDENLVRRFLREGESLSQLRHPNIVHVYETGRTDDYFYIAMELARSTLADRLKSGQMLSNREISIVISQVAMGLDFAHGQGLVHRDIKPSNIMFTEDGRVILTDFGIAKNLSDGDQAITRIGTTVGTPAYMSPEQARAESNIDQRTDIYSLGVVVFHLLTGQVPFTTSNHSELTRLIASHRPPPVRSVNPHVAEPVARVVDQALAPRPQDRFARAGDFAQALYAAINQSQEPVPVQPHAVSATPTERTRTLTRSRSSRPAARTDIWRRRLVSGLLSLAALLAVIGFFGMMAYQLDLLPPDVTAGIAGLVSGEGNQSTDSSEAAPAGDAEADAVPPAATVSPGPEPRETPAQVVALAATATATATASDTATAISTKTGTPTPEPTPSFTPSPTRTATRTATRTTTSVSPQVTATVPHTALSQSGAGNPTATPTPLRIGVSVATVTPAVAGGPTSTPFVVPTSSPTPTARSNPTSRAGTPTRRATNTPAPEAAVDILVDRLNVRSGPGTEYDVVDSVSAGDRFAVIGQYNNCAWLKLRATNVSSAWVSGSAQFVTLDGNCSRIPAVAAPPVPTSAPQPTAAPTRSAPQPTATPASGSEQACVLFVNGLNAELNITFTRQGDGWNTTFLVTNKGESERCFPPGNYTYTLDAPPPWGSTNGTMQLASGDRWRFPVRGN